MRLKAQKTAETLTEILKEWDCIDAIVLAEFADEDILDPYFSLSLDCFYSGEMPDLEKRQSSFEGARFFESSPVSGKDRFLLDDLPVHIEYKNKEYIDTVFQALESDEWKELEKGSYLFYRIKTGKILFSRSDWIKARQKDVKSVSDNFWTHIKQNGAASMEHALNDMNAAVFQKDDYLFQYALSDFLALACRVIFACNCHFDPSPRYCSRQIRSLEVLPAGFDANFEILLRNDTVISFDRKKEVARLLASSIFSII